jgi:hypothetical protein
MEPKMSRDGLITYLNDHLAGSVAALEVLDHLIRLQPGTAVEQALSVVRTEVEGDQQTLQSLLHEAGGKESRVRQAAAWLTEKLGRGILPPSRRGPRTSFGGSTAYVSRRHR